MRFLAAKHGYCIQDPFVDYQANQLIDDFADFFAAISPADLMSAGMMPADGLDSVV